MMLVVGTVAAAVSGADFKMQAQLVWGTNEEKPDKPNLKKVDLRLGEKLGSVFKWKHYFEMNRNSFAIQANGSQTVKLSDGCSLEVKHLGESNFEVKLMGKGKPVVTKRQSIAKGETAVLAGDDKNDTAWFVVVTQPGSK